MSEKLWKVLAVIPVAWKAIGGVAMSLEFWSAIGYSITMSCWIIFWALSPLLVAKMIVGGIDSAPGWLSGIAGVIGAFGFFLSLDVGMDVFEKNSGCFDALKKVNWRLCPVLVIFWHLPSGFAGFLGKKRRHLRLC